MGAHKHHEPPICIVAGGTGGHVFPAIALAHACEAIEQPYHFITDKRGHPYFKTAGLTQSPVVLGLGSKQGGLFGLVTFILQLFVAFCRSIPVVWRCRTMIGFSGYPTFAPLVAGIVLGKTICIHEQNAVLGKVNRILGRFIKHIFVSVPKTQMPQHLVHKCVHTGMPVRPAIEALQDHQYQRPHQDDSIHMLVIGGSQGASILSDAVPKAIAQLPQAIQHRLHLVHQVRPEDLDHARYLYADTHCASIDLKTFIHDMPSLYGQSHLLIARSGASTIAEVEATGCPTVFVPYPHATDDHQVKNAQYICRSGGAWMMTEDELSPEHLSDFLRDVFLAPKKLLFASQRVKKGYLKSRIKVLVDCVLNV